MSQVWCMSLPNDDLVGKNRENETLSHLNNRANDQHAKDFETLFSASVSGISNISSNCVSDAVKTTSEYSLFSSDGLPPPSANFSERSNIESHESFLAGYENVRSHEFGFSLSDLSSKLHLQGECCNDSTWASKSERDRIAAAIWERLPEPTASSSKLDASKVVGAEIHERSNRNKHSSAHYSVNKAACPNPEQMKNLRLDMLSQRHPAPPTPVYHQLGAFPNAAWSASNGPLLTVLPPGNIQSNSNVFRTTVGTVIQPRVINPNISLIQLPTNAAGHSLSLKIPTTSNIITAGRHSQNFSNSSRISGNGMTPSMSLTAPQLHSAIGQINEITVHALNQTAAMIMDRQHLENQLLQHAAEQFKSAYNELALPEPLEPISGRKEASGVDMLLTAQLRENLRINTLVRRIKVVTQLSPMSGGAQAFEKWTDDVRSFQAFLMKMHERARRLHLSTTIAATLYSNNEQSNRATDSVTLANTLGELMTSTLNARQALFQLGERAITLLLAQRQGKSLLQELSAASENVQHSSVANFKHQPIPVNPESAQQLWSQLGQLSSHGF